MRDPASIVDAFVGTPAEFWAKQVIQSHNIQTWAKLYESDGKTPVTGSDSVEFSRYFQGSRIQFWLSFDAEADLEVVATLSACQAYWTVFHPNDHTFAYCDPEDLPLAPPETTKTLPNGCVMAWVVEGEQYFVCEEIYNEDILQKDDGTWDILGALMSAYDHFTDPEIVCRTPGCNCMETSDGKFGGYCERCLQQCSFPCKRCNTPFGFIDHETGYHPYCKPCKPNRGRPADQPMFIEETDEEL